MKPFLFEYNRQKFIYSIVKATELLHQQNYKEALSEIKKYFKKDKNDMKLSNYMRRKFSIKLLNYLIKKRSENLEVNIQDYYNSIIIFLNKEFSDVKFKKLSKLKPSSYINKIASVNKYKDLIQSLSFKEDKSNIITIHKAKGTEFDNVLICICDKIKAKKTISGEEIFNKYIVKGKDYINLDTDDGEESRIYYVACSRAKENLFINVPTLNKNDFILEDVEFVNLN